MTPNTKRIKTNNSLIKISSFTKLYNETDKKTSEIINKEINLAKKKDSSELRNLIRIKKTLGKTNKKEILETQNKINKISKIIKSEINQNTQFFLSGSIIKGTYVHGLSDIDILVSLNKNDSNDILSTLKCGVSRMMFVLISYVILNCIKLNKSDAGCKLSTTP